MALPAFAWLPCYRDKHQRQTCGVCGCEFGRHTGGEFFTGNSYDSHKINQKQTAATE